MQERASTVRVFGGFPDAIFSDEDVKIPGEKAKGTTKSLHSIAREGAGVTKAAQILPLTIQLGYF